MRIRSSFAAAVAAAAAAVVLSVALPTANATTIVIDTFTNSQSPNPATFSTSATGTNTSGIFASGTPSGTVYDTRDLIVNYTQNQGSGRTPATLSGTANAVTGGGGSLLWTTNKTATAGTAYNNLGIPQSLSYSNTNSSGFDWTSFGNNALRITKSAGSFTTSSGTIPSFILQIDVNDTDGGFASYPLTIADWFSSTTLEIPYTSFQGSVDFTKISSVLVDSSWDMSGSGFTNAQKIGSVNTSVTLTEIALVPEPTQMVFVAGVGAALGAWRMRKLRRNRGESEAAAV